MIRGDPCRTTPLVKEHEIQNDTVNIFWYGSNDTGGFPDWLDKGDWQSRTMFPNWDRVIRVPHFPEPGETLRSHSISVGLGGKGLNQSVAIMRAGGTVQHVGAVGANDTRIRDVLHDLGLRDNFIVGVVGVETGSATILVDDSGENLIVLDEGANGKLPGAAVSEAVDQAQLPLECEVEALPVVRSGSLIARQRSQRGYPGGAHRGGPAAPPA